VVERIVWYVINKMKRSRIVRGGAYYMRINVKCARWMEIRMIKEAIYSRKMEKESMYEKVHDRCMSGPRSTKRIEKTYQKTAIKSSIGF
jgi:hypothetical protein